MDFLTIEALAKACGKSRRTCDRKIQAYKKENPESFSQLTRQGEGKQIVYSPQFLALLGISKEYVEDVKSELLSEPKIKKEKKPRSEPRPIQASVIQVDQVPAGYEKDLADFQLIMEDYKTGEWSLPECIARHGIKQNVFFHWINSRTQFNDLYTEVYELHKRSFNILMRELAKNSLRNLVTGYDKLVESVTYKELISPTGQAIRVPMERKSYQKHFSPNVNAVTFALTNRDPDEWKRFWNREEQEKGRIIDPLDNMSEDELFGIVEEAKRTGLLTAGDLNQTQP